jgi:hypothetical protein
MLVRRLADGMTGSLAARSVAITPVRLLTTAEDRRQTRNALLRQLASGPEGMAAGNLATCWPGSTRRCATSTCGVRGRFRRPPNCLPQSAGTRHWRSG